MQQQQQQQQAAATPPKMFSRSTASGPTMDGDIDHITIVKHMIAVQVVADKEGITPVVKGDGAGTEPDNDRYGRQNIIDGRKWLLSTFESAAIQALLAEQSTHAPGIWHYIHTTFIGNAPRQDTIRTILTSMYFDGSQNPVEFTSQFLLLAKEMDPALPAAQAKTILGGCFPAGTVEGYHHIISTLNLQYPNATLAEFVVHFVNALQRNASLSVIQNRHRFGQDNRRGNGYMLHADFDDNSGYEDADFSDDDADDFGFEEQYSNQAYYVDRTTFTGSSKKTKSRRRS